MAHATVTSRDRLVLTLVLAAALHAIAILGIGFSPLDPAGGDEAPLPTLDITLVHSEDSEAPDEAQQLAQHDQRGGGTEQQDATPGSPTFNPLPVPKDGDDPTTEPDAAPPPEPDPSSGPELLTRDEADTRVAQETVRDAVPEERTVTAADLVRSSREYTSLDAEIRRQREAQSENPREKHISADTREYKYAAYMDAWRAQVERVGNIHYPEEARRQGLSGRLVLNVIVEADGNVRDVQLLRSSGNRILDEAAIRIVNQAAPFQPLPDDVREDFDALHITRTWVFNTGDGMATGRVR